MVGENKFKIGIVEDHIQSAIFIANMLENEGFKTFQAYNAADTLKMVEQEKPDLLLLDVKMDHTSGFDIAKQIPKTEIFLLTGFDISKSELSKYKNVLGIIRKPVDIRILMDVVRKELKVKA